MPDYTLVMDGSKTYELAVTYDATPYNAGPGTHPDIASNGGDQEGYALQMHIREVGESVWHLPKLGHFSWSTTGDAWDNSPQLEPTTAYKEMELSCALEPWPSTTTCCPWPTS